MNLKKEERCYDPEKVKKTPAIISLGMYIFNPLIDGQFCSFKGLFLF
jgi:hypothetical protein